MCDIMSTAKVEHLSAVHSCLDDTSEHLLVVYVDMICPCKPCVRVLICLLCVT